MKHLFTLALVLCLGAFASAQTDLALTSFDTMTSGCGLTTQIVRVNFSNVGSTVINGPAVSYRVNGGAAVNGTIAGAIPVGGTGSFNFPAAYIFPSTGTFVFEAWVRATGDNNTLNDTAFRSVVNLSSKTGGDTLNFDVNSSLATGGSNTSWEHGAPWGSAINTAPSSPNIWGTNLTGNYNNFEDSWIQTGCYDLTGLFQPMVRFDLNYRTENSYDGAILEASTDGGSTWTTIGDQGSGNNWYNGAMARAYYNGPVWMNNSNGWLSAEHNLSSLPSLRSVIFRFHFFSDGSVVNEGFGIDNFEIFDSLKIPHNLTIDTVFIPRSITCGNVNEIAKVKVFNNSNYILSNIPIKLTANGNIFIERISNSIGANSSYEYTFSNSVILKNGANNWLVELPTVQSSNPFQTTFSLNFTVNNNDSNFLTLPDTLRSSTRPVVLAPGNASTYRWSTGDTTANLSVNTAGTYSVTASNAAGCSSADSVLVLFSNPAPALPAHTAGVFNYQASVVSGGKPLANRSLSVRFTVADSTATNYSEIQQITTDARGHFATQVGAGNPISGSLSDVSWWDGLPRTLKTEVDTNGSGNWVVLGSSSLVAVPVSMYALRSGDGSRSIYGSFDSNGNVVSGRGFSVTPLGNGKFELVFQQPFTELPNVFLEFTGNGVFSKKILSRNTQKTTIEISGNPDQIQFEAKGK